MRGATRRAAFVDAANKSWNRLRLTIELSVHTVGRMNANRQRLTAPLARRSNGASPSCLSKRRADRRSPLRTLACGLSAPTKSGKRPLGREPRAPLRTYAALHLKNRRSAIWATVRARCARHDAANGSRRDDSRMERPPARPRRMSSSHELSLHIPRAAR